MLRLLRMMMRHAVLLGWRDDNPCSVEKVPHKVGGFRRWGDAQIDAYRRRHATGTVARLALELLLNIGPRRGDAVKLGRQHMRDGRLSFRQSKTGGDVTVPILPALAAEIAHLPAGQMTFLEVQGRARSPMGLYNVMREWCVQAGIPPGYSPRGLRKACGRILADAGCTMHEIMAVLGHKTLSEAQKYFEDANRRRNADNTVGKVAGIGNAGWRT